VNERIQQPGDDPNGEFLKALDERLAMLRVIHDGIRRYVRQYRWMLMIGTLVFGANAIIMALYMVLRVTGAI
jgi:hypothetical protein